MAAHKGELIGGNVWAESNTRGAIFDAMRREVYATTGPCMRVRFFGGFNFIKDDKRRRDLALVGYTKGVPMGSDLARRLLERRRLRRKQGGT